MLAKLRSVISRNLRNNRVMHLNRLNSLRLDLDKRKTTARSACASDVVRGIHILFHPNAIVRRTVGGLTFRQIPIGCGGRRRSSNTKIWSRLEHRGVAGMG